MLSLRGLPGNLNNDCEIPPLRVRDDDGGEAFGVIVGSAQDNN